MLDFNKPYQQVLADAWNLHLAPRSADAPTVISTFAGCGGSSLGYSMAGYRELLAVEWDDNAVDTFRLNFPEAPVFHGDIAELPVEECLRSAGIKPGQLDVFDGSPPCQGFSTAGSRSFDDPRNRLFEEYVRLLRGLRPKCFVMENVSGMVKGKMKLIFARILRELRACGYQVRARLLNAMYFGVPQSRERMIVIGVREDIDAEPSHPTGMTWPIPVGRAIGNLDHGKPGDHSPQVLRAWEQCRKGKSLRKACSHVGSFQSVRLDPLAPSYTQLRSHLHWHWAVPRQLTILEAAILAGFPPAFQFAGSRQDAKGVIGNCVPPLFMLAIADHVRRNILSAGRNGSMGSVIPGKVVSDGK